ncbi:MAG TPA: phenylacetate-CoA oxygenase subunit PaaJ, partial [Bacilli bacterium]|nr:phenylacetate-CoA oxygenase subunit PaaJ [Bacilli bacterium]
MSTTSAMSLEEEVKLALQEVVDPEIPIVSIEEFGMIYKINVNKPNVHIELLPTFVGCPALNIIEQNVVNAVKKNVEWADEVTVSYVYDISWTSDRISKEARPKLKEFGIAPPPENYQEGDKWEVECPYCGSPYTSM